MARARRGVRLTEFVTAAPLADPAVVGARRAELAAAHGRRTRELAERERPDPEVITPEYLVACVRRALAEHTEDVIVLTEAISNYQVVGEHLRVDRPGALLGSGGGSLGWHAGAAVGVKLARPDALVVSLVGDGTYLFGVPASAQWVASRYRTPSLTVIMDNQGWMSPKLSTLGVHPEGSASARDDFNVSFAPRADLPGVAAAAGGAWARSVARPDELPAALAEAVAVVRSGRSAVLSAHLPGVA